MSVRSEFDKLHAAARAEIYPALERRQAWLKSLRECIVNRRPEIIAAIDDDFGGRSAEETLMAEIATALSTIDYCRQRLPRWMRPSRRSADWRFQLSSNSVVYQPLGVVGVLSPWNYPFNLALLPSINALAAGNRVMLRPSGQTPRTAELIRKIFSDALPSDVACVIAGGREVADEMLALPFDHLVFTGSTGVGRKVMRAAAEHLTPVTLELGGKSPVIVHPSYPLKNAAERIMMGKLLNAGQTCIAPDYAMVCRDQRDAFVAAASEAVNSMYPDVLGNPQYSSILGAAHAERLHELVADAREKGAEIVEPQGQAASVTGANEKRFAPVFITGVTDEMRIAEEEIFGPILPIHDFATVERAFEYVARRPRPLAFYYFDEDERRIDRFLRECVSGGAAVNDTLLHVAQDDLPFGGVGGSGMGRYHAEEGFRSFSNARSVYRPWRWNLARTLRPPWSSRMRKLIERSAR